MKRFIHLMAASALVLAAASCSSSSKKAADEAAGADETTAQTASPEVAAPKAGVVNELPAGGTLNPADKPIIIDFNAVWCGPCKMFAPVFAKAAADMADKYYFYSVDIDKCPKMAEVYEATSIPQISVLKPDGTIVNFEPGYRDYDQFVELIKDI